MVSKRDKASRGLLACAVVNEPSWPVFIACNISSASPERTSPTIILSGRIRRALRTKSRIEICPLPSIFAGRDSKVTTCSCCRRNSAASSIVTMRSRWGRKEETTFKVVVLPEPVPPDTKILTRALTQACKNFAIFSSRVPKEIKFSTVNGFLENLRMVTAGPTKDSGGMMMFTREPSSKRASTNGEDSSIRRPNGVKIRSMIFNK